MHKADEAYNNKEFHKLSICIFDIEKASIILLMNHTCVLTGCLKHGSLKISIESVVLKLSKQ